MPQNIKNKSLITFTWHLIQQPLSLSIGMESFILMFDQFFLFFFLIFGIRFQSIYSAYMIWI